MRMLHSTASHPMDSVIETYAMLFNHLALSVYDLLDAIKCVILHIIAIAVIPIFFLSITCYTIVTAFMGVTPQQDSQHPLASSTRTLSMLLSVDSNSSSRPADSKSIPHDTSPTSLSVDSDCSIIPADSQSVRHATSIKLHPVVSRSPSIGHLDSSLKDLPEGCIKSATVVKGDGRLHIIPMDIPPALPPNPQPAIPAHLKDCEFFYNTVDMNRAENFRLLENGEQQLVRITVDEQCRTCVPAYATFYLQSLEDMRKLGVNAEGRLELSPGKRGRLELRHRVYVGPAEWLLRVLMEEMWPLES